MQRNNIFYESFKVGGGGKANTTQGAASGTASGAVAGAATGALISGGSAALMSNSGSNNVEKCPISDDSLYCQVSRTAGITGMIIYILLMIIFVIAFFYFLYLFIRSGSSNAGKSVGKGRK